MIIDAAVFWLLLYLGLMGSSDWEAAKINMVVDCVTDFVKPMFAYFYEKNENTKVL